MPTTLNEKAYQQLIDEDIEWLRKQPRSLERDHIEVCLKWLRENKQLLNDYDRLQRGSKHYFVVPMPLNKEGKGPEMDVSEVHHTKWEIWNDLNEVVDSFDSKEEANEALRKLCENM